MDMLGSHRALGGAVHLASERATGQPHANEQGESLTYNRMEAKLIAGEHGRSVAMPKLPLSKRRVVISGFVVIRHLCRFEGVECKWSMNASACVIPTMRISTAARGSCHKCREFWSPRDDQRYAENPINWPRY